MKGDSEMWSGRPGCGGDPRRIRLKAIPSSPPFCKGQTRASRADAVSLESHFVTRITWVNVGLCQIVRSAPWARNSVVTKWGSQPLKPNLKGDEYTLW